MTAQELRRSNLLEVLQFIDEEPNINKEVCYFSYEHFYVIYTCFWKLDKDRDLSIDQAELSRHGDCGEGAAPRAIVRHVGGALFLRSLLSSLPPPRYSCCVLFPRPLLSRPGQDILRDGLSPARQGRSNVLLGLCLLHPCRGGASWAPLALAQAPHARRLAPILVLLCFQDKTTATAIEYWFRIMDLDGDGVLSLYELEQLYAQQVGGVRTDAAGVGCGRCRTLCLIVVLFPP